MLRDQQIFELVYSSICRDNPIEGINIRSLDTQCNDSAPVTIWFSLTFLPRFPGTLHSRFFFPCPLTFLRINFVINVVAQESRYRYSADWQRVKIYAEHGEPVYDSLNDGYLHYWWDCEAAASWTASLNFDGTRNHSHACFNSNYRIALENKVLFVGLFYFSVK